MRHLSKVVFFGCCLAIPNSALAYIGPGAGLGAIAVMVALLLGALLLIVGLVWYPLKRLLKGKSDRTANGNGSGSGGAE